MGPFKRILVDIDATVSAHPALERAVRLAAACGATLTVADVITIPAEARRYLQPNLEEELVNRRREQLEKVVAGLTGVRATPALLTGRPGTVLIQEVLREGHDLLVRSHARDLIGGPKPFGPVDMDLLRKCPCPVLIVGPGAPPARPRTVGAVHGNPADPTEQALNIRIIELTLLMARLEKGPATLLQAWEPFGESLVRSHYTDEGFAAYVDDARERAAADFDELLASFRDRLAGAEVVLRRGEPDAVIPAFAVAEGVDLVVMGTVARTGIAGLLMGNTAERVLRRLPCSVLAIKPEGFVSPVTLD